MSQSVGDDDFTQLARSLEPDYVDERDKAIHEWSDGFLEASIASVEEDLASVTASVDEVTAAPDPDMQDRVNERLRALDEVLDEPTDGDE